MREKRMVELGLAEFVLCLFVLLVALAVAQGLHDIATALEQIAEALK